MTAASLFAACPVPGCANVTDDPRQPCGGCLAAFGAMLRQSADEPMMAAEYAAVITERDAALRAILAERAAFTPLGGAA